MSQLGPGEAFMICRICQGYSSASKVSVIPDCRSLSSFQAPSQLYARRRRHGSSSCVCPFSCACSFACSGRGSSASVPSWDPAAAVSAAAAEYLAPVPVPVPVGLVGGRQGSAALGDDCGLAGLSLAASAAFWRRAAVPAASTACRLRKAAPPPVRRSSAVIWVASMPTKSS